MEGTLAVWLLEPETGQLEPALLERGHRIVRGNDPPPRPRPEALLVNAAWLGEGLADRVRECMERFPAMAPVLAGVTRRQIELQTLSVGRYRMLAGALEPAGAVRAVEAAVEAVRREAGPIARPDTKTIHVELPSVVDLVQPLALYLTRECRTMGWPEEPLSTAIPLCLTEALVNAVVHGNRESPARRVQAEVRLTPGQFWSNITDEGQGFDPVRVPPPTLPENLLREHGRGLFLMRHYMSEVSFNAKGNSVTLIRRIGPAGV